MTRSCLQCLAAPIAVLVAATAPAIPPSLQETENRRIATVQRITPCVVAVMEPSGEGGGSGVLISSDGLALTNFHVVAPCGSTMPCGLPDGQTYEAELIGLDPTGDIALIQLKGRDDFPAAVRGDSDRVGVGDEALVLGNPFLLATDYRPSVSCGIISGVGRYQYPADTILEYADCLQTDAAINPGNSGGPLFDANGCLIGINGRASFGGRGRVNVGVGYAVSINQAARFLPQLKAGRIVDHASLEATAITLAGAAVVEQVEPRSATARAGLRRGDRVLAVDGRQIRSANALKNAIGVYPAGWVVAIEVARGGERHTLQVRLAPQHVEADLLEAVAKQTRSVDAKGGKPAPRTVAGLANERVNQREVHRLLRPFQPAAATRAPWEASGEDSNANAVVLLLGDEQSSLESDQGRFFVNSARPIDVQDSPPGSGGLLVGFHLLRRLLMQEPLDRMVAWGQTPWPAPGEYREAIRVEHRGVVAEYYFDGTTSELVGFEIRLAPNQAPCVVRLRRDETKPGVDAHVAYADGTVYEWRLGKLSPENWLEPARASKE